MTGDILHATPVTWEWVGYRNKNQHRKLTPKKKILLPLLPGLEPGTFRSRVRRSNHWAIPASAPAFTSRVWIPQWSVHEQRLEGPLWRSPTALRTALWCVHQNHYGQCSEAFTNIIMDSALMRSPTSLWTALWGVQHSGAFTNIIMDSALMHSPTSLWTVLLGVHQHHYGQRSNAFTNIIKDSALGRSPTSLWTVLWSVHQHHYGQCSNAFTNIIMDSALGRSPTSLWTAL